MPYSQITITNSSSYVYDTDNSNGRANVCGDGDDGIPNLGDMDNTYHNNHSNCSA